MRSRKATPNRDASAGSPSIAVALVDTDHKDNAMDIITTTTPATAAKDFRAELQSRIERLATILAQSAVASGSPYAVWTATAGIGRAMEIAVRQMNTRPANRAAAMKAIDEHVSTLMQIVHDWQENDVAG